MDRRERMRRAIAEFDPGVDLAALQEHLALVDEDYLGRYSPEDVARHLRLSTQLDPSEPVQLEVRPDATGEHEVTLVAYDYFGELALLCGLLASFGLDIRSGQIHTFSPAPESPGVSGQEGRRPSGRQRRAAASRIVDVFIVRPAEGVGFGALEQASLAVETKTLLRLVSEGALAAARDRVNRRLAERLEAQRGRCGSLSAAVETRFAGAAEAGWSVVEVRGHDTPAFLYALTNALSLRGVYIRRVEIESVGPEVRDRFLIADRSGRPIESDEERAALRTAVGLTKQFTHFLTSAPDPATAIHAFDQLVDAILARGIEGRSPPALSEEDLDALAHLLGSSRFLWEDFLRMQAADLLSLLGRVKADALPRGRVRFEAELRACIASARSESRVRALNDYKDRTMVAIDLKQLLDPSVSLAEFSATLSELAQAVLATALEMCAAGLVERHGRPRLVDGSDCAVALCGLGKFGGGEMGYASDVELLLVYGGAGRSDGVAPLENAAWCEALARALLEMIEARREGVFSIDLRLRPYGRKGALASSLEQLERYYSRDGEAAPFERQALVKLRRVAGDESLGQRVEALRDRFVYDGAPWDREAARRLRGRQIRELVKPAGAVNVKYGAGGMIDVEYAVQYLQIQHGAAWPDLRSPNTLAALDGLRMRGVVSGEEHDRLQRAYLFLRRVVDALRMVRGNAKDLVLPAEDSDEYKFLARRLGLKRESWAAAAAALAQELRRQMSAAHEFYVQRFGDPLAGPS